MRKYKGILALFLCLGLILTAAACAPATTDPTQQHSEPSVDKYGRYNPPIEVTLVHTSDDGLFWFPEGDSMEYNIYTRRFYQELGIRYRFLWTSPSSHAEEKMNVMLAAANLPDMMNVSRQVFERLQRAGKLADLTDAIENYASDFTRRFLTGDYAPMLDAVTKDGRQWGVPNGMVYLDMAHAIWIRADWLENVGLPAPKTLQELEAIMEAFVNDDPDKNGKNDTYAVALGAADMGSSFFGVGSIFFNMFHSYPGIWMLNTEGELECGIFGPEQRDNTRRALAAFAEYYEKGYIHKDFGLFDSTRVREEIANGRAGIVFGYTWDAWGDLMFNVEMDENADWVPVPVPTSDGKPAKMTSRAVDILNVNVVTAGFEHPEALVKMCNLFHDLNNNPETMEFNKYNVQPEDNNQIFLAYPLHVYNPSFNYDGYVAIASAIDTGDDSHLSEAYRSFYDLLMAFKNERDPAGFPSYRTYTEGGIMALSRYYDENKLIQFDEFAQEPTEFMIEHWPSVKKAYDQMFFSVATGRAGISEFDRYMDFYDSIYLEGSMKEVNASFRARGSNSVQAWFDSK